MVLQAHANVEDISIALIIRCASTTEEAALKNSLPSPWEKQVQPLRGQLCPLSGRL